MTYLNIGCLDGYFTIRNGAITWFHLQTNNLMGVKALQSKYKFRNDDEADETTCLVARSSIEYVIRKMSQENDQFN